MVVVMVERQSITIWLWHAAEPQRGRLLLWLPVWMGSGIGGYYALRAEPPLWLAGALLLAALVCSIISTAWAHGRMALVPAAAILVGFAAAQIETAAKPPLVQLPKHSVLIEGRVAAVDLLPDGGRRVSVAAAEIAGNPALHRLIRITMQPDDPVTPGIGDQVRTRALLRNPDPPSWPGARDPQFEDYFANIDGSGRALGLLEDLGGGRGAGMIARLREAIAAKVTAALPGSEGEIAATLMAGATAAIPEPDRQAFAASGLAHILAVAGLHMATVIGVVFGAVRLGLVLVPRWGLTLPCKAIAACAGLLAGLGYLLLTGAHVPTERSFAMASLVVLAILMGRRAVSLRSLALAALVVLLAAPDALVGVSFQMSFAAVLALIAGYRAMAPWFAGMREWSGPWGWTARHLIALCATSFLAGTATLPFAAAGFGQIQIYYVLANLIAVPVTVLVVMPMAVAALLLMPFGAAFPALWLMGKGITVILWIARLVSALPAAVVAWPPTPAWGLIAVGFGIAALGLMQGRVRLVGLLPLALGLAAPFLAASPDFVVARDGRAVAWRQANVIQLWQAKSGAKYELEDWRKLWPRAVWQSTDCANGICRWAGGQANLLIRISAVDCNAKLILSVIPLHDACPWVTSIDRFDLWRNGAYEGWWHGGAVVMISDRSLRGARPWVPIVGGTALVGEPLAQSE